MKKAIMSLALGALAVFSSGATETFEYSYCSNEISREDIYGAVTCMGAAIEVPASEAEAMKGYKVVGMYIGGGAGSVKVTPFVATKFGADTDRSYLSTKQTTLTPYEWNQLTFSKPYEITGERFFIGYFSTMITSSLLAIPTDGVIPSSEYNWWGYGDSTSQMWEGFKQETAIGNFCIRLIIEGDEKPVDRVAVRTIDVPVFVNPGQPFEMTVSCSNDGYNTVSSVGGTITIGEQAPVSFERTFETPLEHGEYTNLEFDDVVCDMESSEGQPVVVKIETVNGEPNKSSMSSFTTSVVCAQTGFVRNVVIEEGTGTWCGNCVYGIAGVERMKEKVTDGSFMCIAVHVNDIYEPSSYSSFITANYTEVPNAQVMRKESMFPSMSTLPDYYEKYHGLALAKVDLVVEYDQKSNMNELTLLATTEFATAHNNIDYALGFVQTEDNVGPAAQTNYAAGATEDVGGLEKMDNPAIVYLQDVARQADGLYGLSDSVINDAEAGEQVEYSCKVSTPNVINKQNMAVTALLFDRKSGEIVNATRVYADEFKQTSGVSEIAGAEAEAEAVYYNMQGVRVAEPTVAGVYVRQCGNKVEKVVIR